MKIIKHKEIYISLSITLLGLIYYFVKFDNKITVVNIITAVLLSIYAFIGNDVKNIKKHCKEADIWILSLITTFSMLSVFIRYGLKTILLGSPITLGISLVLFCKLKNKWSKCNIISNEDIFPKKNAIIIFIYSMISLSLMWIKVYPNGVSPDTINQWDQVHTGQYSNIHAIGHTIFLKWLLSIHDCYNIVILVHILMISLMYTAYSYYFSKRKVKMGIQLLLVSIFTSGFAGISAYFYPWKDTPYTFCVGMTTLLLIDYLENREKFNVIKSVLLGIFTVYIALFRLNGIMITAFVTVYMIITLLRNKKIKQMLAVIIPIVVIYSGIHYYAYDVLKTESPVNGFSMQQVISNISAAVEDNASDEEIAMVDEVTDVEFIKEHYTPWHGEKLIWAEDNHSFMTELGSNKKELILVYIKLIPKHFISMFKDIIHNTVIAWGHMDKKEYIWNNAYEWLAIFDNVSLMLIFASVIMSIKNRKRYMSKNVIIFMPILLNMLSIVMTTITNEQRYFLPTVTLFPILITYILCQVKQTAVESR